MNLKKLLSIIGLLTAAVPISLSTIACNNNQINTNDDNEIISIIDKNNNLEMNITSKETSQKIINVLNNSSIADIISKTKNISNTFKKELFKIKNENIYLDKNKINKIDLKKNIEDDKIYYIEYSYNNKKSTTLIAVKVTNIDKVILNTIKNASYNIPYNGELPKEEEVIKKFIKHFLTAENIKKEIQIKEIRDTFDNKSFKIESISDIKNDDNTISAKVTFTYNNAKNISINFIAETTSDRKIVNDIKKQTYTIEIDEKMTKKEDEIINIIKNKFTAENIKKDLNQNSKDKFDNNSFKIESISDIKNNDDNTISAKVTFTYNNIEANIKLTIQKISRIERVSRSIKNKTNEIKEKINLKFK